MIEIVYHPEHYRLTVKGHAGYDVPGKDIVCAGVSALTCTLAEDIIALEGSLREPPHILLDEGNAEIECKPRSNQKSIVRLVMNSVCAGFAMMADKYSEHVTYETRV